MIERELNNIDFSQTVEPGAPMRCDACAPFKLLEGRAEIYLRGDHGQHFICEVHEGDVVFPNQHPNIDKTPADANLTNCEMVMVVMQALRLSSIDVKEVKHSADQWREVAIKTLSIIETDALLKHTPTAFNSAIYNILKQRSTAQDIQDLQRISNPATNTIENDDLLAVCARHLRVASNNAKQAHCAFENIPNQAHLHGLRVRKVSLGNNWLKSEQGPLLLEKSIADKSTLSDDVGVTKPHSAVYCALWDGQQYALHDGSVLDQSNRFDFKQNAYAVFAPLPETVDGFWSLAKYILRGNNRELKTVAKAASFVALLGLLVPLATGWILSDITPSGDVNMLIGVAIALLLAALVSVALSTIRALAVARIQGRTDMNLNAALYDRLLQLPTGFFKRFSAGDLNQRLSNVNEVKQLILSASLSVGIAAILSLFYFAVMVFYDLRLALISLCLVAIYILSVMLARIVQRPFLTKAYELDGELAEQGYEMISAVPKLRSAAAEQRILSRWTIKYNQERQLEQKIAKVGGVFAAFSDAWQIFTLVILFAAAGAIANMNLSPGLFIAYLAAFGAFQGAFSGLAAQAIEIYAAQPQIDRALPILTARPEQRLNQSQSSRLTGALEIRDLRFAYNEGQNPVLNGVAMSIQAGQHVAIVGSSGSGKSTLLRLLLGFETPLEGAILYDQQDLAQLDASSVRKQIGVVLQSSSLYAGSIISNIRGASDASLEQCLYAVRQAGLEADLEEFPMGIHTAITEGAATLSGGQRQRLLIARSLVNSPAILYYDEATSALDNATQASVAETLDKMPITRITIAHRLSTIRHADVICVLQDGRFIEQGDYQQLMAADGVFAALAHRQLINANH